MDADGQPKFVDYYEVLSVPTHASLAELKKAYLLHAKRMHPDAGGSVEQMQGLNTAYSTLKDAVSRRAYDHMHQFHTGTAALHYRGEQEKGSGLANDMDDAAMDAFVNSVFREYSAPQPKTPLHAKLKKRFRR